jgi:hypothetical protein
MDNRCLATALLVKEVDDLFDSFNVAARYPNHGRLLHFLLTSSIRQWNTGEVQLITKQP